MFNMGEANCQVRIERGDNKHSYIAGIVRVEQTNKLIVQRVSLWAQTGTPYEVVPPEAIPDFIHTHPEIARWNDVEFETASLEEAKKLISGEYPTHRILSLGHVSSFMERPSI